MRSALKNKSLLAGAPFSRRRVSTMAIALLGLCASAVWAGPGGTISPVVLHIAAESGPNSATWQADFDPAFFDAATGIYNWTLPDSIDLMDGPTLVATLNSATLHLDTDPEVSLGFHATAPGSATVITITSALVSFSGIFEPDAFATAGITVTDNGFNGASLTGEYAGNTKSYIANYNGLAPAGTNYATLVDNVPFFVGGSPTESETKPFQTLTGETVSSISSQFSFELSAGDQASGTSTFIITPEPTTMGLLTIGALTVLRRRA